jgi:hypothetical protein
MPYTSATQTADQVTLGAFTLSDGLVRQINAFEPVSLPGLPPDAPAGLRLDGEHYYLGADPRSPAIGDVRIRFAVVPPTTVSVVAAQQGSALVAYQTRAGRALEMLEVGTHGAAEMFQAAISRNRAMTWVLRFVGFLLMAIGLGMVFRPFAVVGDVIPVIGSILRGGIGLFAIVVSLVLTLTVVAVAWVFYRPLLGVGLLVGAGGLLAAGILIARRRKPALPPLPT